MGRLRASLPEVLGIKFDFDRVLVLKRLRDMAVPEDSLPMLLAEMEASHTRAAFLNRITKHKNGVNKEVKS